MFFYTLMKSGQQISEWILLQTMRDTHLYGHRRVHNAFTGNQCTKSWVQNNERLQNNQQNKWISKIAYSVCLDTTKIAVDPINSRKICDFSEATRSYFKGTVILTLILCDRSTIPNIPIINSKFIVLMHKMNTVIFKLI